MSYIKQKYSRAHRRSYTISNRTIRFSLFSETGADQIWTMVLRANVFSGLLEHHVNSLSLCYRLRRSRDTPLLSSRGWGAACLLLCIITDRIQSLWYTLVYNYTTMTRSFCKTFIYNPSTVVHSSKYIIFVYLFLLSHGGNTLLTIHLIYCPTCIRSG